MIQQTPEAAPFSGWPSVAIDLVSRAAEAHGGFARFDQVESVSFTVKSLTGPLPWLKAIHALPPRIEVFPHELKTIYHEYPESDQFGIFDRGNVSLRSRRAPNEVIVDSLRHRDTFRGFAKNRRWSTLDTLYFFGYAWVNYLSLPFLLKDLAFVDSCQWLKSGRIYHGVTVDFPDGFDTHGKRQTFYFGDDGLLARHDYQADVVGSWATGAHFSNNYEFVDGFAFATRRNVVGMLGSWVTPMPVLNGIVSDFVVRLRVA